MEDFPKPFDELFTMGADVLEAQAVLCRAAAGEEIAPLTMMRACTALHLYGDHDKAIALAAFLPGAQAELEEVT